MLLKNKQKEKNINPAAAVSAGVIIGASVAIAGAVALKDKKTQEKVKKAMKDVKNHVVDYVEDMKKGAEVKDTKGKEKLPQSTKEKTVVDSTVDDVKEVKKSS